MLTPKPRDALLAAFRARQHSLTRCRGGFSDTASAVSPASIVTVRTANALVDMRLAIYDHPRIPLRLSLTADGIAEARRILTVIQPAHAA